MIKPRNKKYLHPFLEIRSTKNMGRGVYATQNIGQQVVLMQIDEKQFFTYEKVFQHPVYGFLAAIDVEDLKFRFSFMIASIARTPLHQLKRIELKHDRKFYDYIKQLPKKFNNLICWTKQQLSLLDDKDLEQCIIQKQKILAQSYSNILSQTKQRLRQTITRDTKTIYNQSKHSQVSRGNRRRQFVQFNTALIDCQANGNIDRPAVPKDEQSENQSEESFIQGADFTKLPFDQIYSRMLEISFDQVLIHYAAIESRSLYYTTSHDSKSQVGALVPLLQLINHSQNPHCEAVCEGRRLLVKSVKQIRKDEEIFMDYKLDNLHTALIKFGFVNIDINREIRQQLSQQIRQKLYQQQLQKKVDPQRNQLARQYRKIRKLIQQGQKSTQSDQTFEGTQTISFQV